MRRFVLFFLLFCLCPAAAHAQPKAATIKDTLQRVSELREQIRQSVLSDDPVEAEPPLSELRRLSNENQTTLSWDERWLLYHWMGLYAALFDEVRHHSYNTQYHEAENLLYVKDSLFEAIDRLMYTHYYDAVPGLGFEKRSEEEQEFATIHLAYLLRLNSDAEKERREAFLTQYPQSGFTKFIKTFMKRPPQPAKSGGCFDFGLYNTNWQGTEIERSLRTGWGFQLGLGYLKKDLHLNFRFARTYQDLNRNLFEDSDVWAKGSTAYFSQFGIEAGYNVLNKRKIGVFPSVEAGLVSIKPEAIDEEDPDAFLVSPVFRYRGVPFWGLALNADIRMGDTEPDPFNRYSSRGFRLRTGFSRFNFSSKQPLLEGNVFFFALLFQVSG